MKLSCNGCRILRKGCSDNCIIRPCLEWINSPESQANATLFLAKFYGRTGLLNLITAAPQHLAPAAFRSLLYEACGRIVNPTYGSMGLLWTGEWAQCEAAVDAVLTGSKINGVPVSDWRNGGTRVTGLTEPRETIRFVRTANIIKPEPQLGSLDSTPFWKTRNAETVEASSLLTQLEPNPTAGTRLDLELSLGWGPPNKPTF